MHTHGWVMISQVHELAVYSASNIDWLHCIAQAVWYYCGMQLSVYYQVSLRAVSASLCRTACLGSYVVRILNCFEQKVYSFAACASLTMCVMVVAVPTTMGCLK